MEQTNRQPDRRFKCGGVIASIWVNDTGESGHGMQAKIQLVCHFQASDGQWGKTTSFNINDLPRVSAVVRRAYDWLNLTEEEPTPKTQEAQPAVIEERVQ